MSERFINDPTDEYDIIRDSVTGEIWNLEGCRYLLNKYDSEVKRLREELRLALN